MKFDLKLSAVFLYWSAFFGFCALVLFIAGTVDLLSHNWWAFAEIGIAGFLSMLFGHFGKIAGEQVSKEDTAQTQKQLNEAALLRIGKNDPTKAPMPRTPEDLLMAVAGIKD